MKKVAAENNWSLPLFNVLFFYPSSQGSNTYHKMPVRSPGFIQLCKVFPANKQKILLNLMKIFS